MSGNLPDSSRLGPPWLEAHQAQKRPPTDYENLLGDAMEAAFATGAWELDALIARLNADQVRAPDGLAWTAESFKAVMAGLAEG